MHVGLNLIYLVPGETGGMEVVARELIPELVAAGGDEVRFTAFINREAAEDGGGPWNELIPSVVVPVRARRRVEWVCGEQLLLPRLAARAGVDLVHSFANTAPGWGRYRRAVTVHDLIYRIYPETHSGVLTLGLRALVRLAVSRSDRVIVDSQSTGDDVMRLLGAPADQVDVVPLGIGATATGVALPEADLRRELELGDRPIVLSVSAKRPHKNLLRLIDAVASFSPEERPLLVLPGYATWHEAELRERAATRGVAADVRFLGWVSAAQLEGLYAAAACFVFPSLYEGFGLPVLEAMARGTPVACSNTSSLPEVAGDAALLFDPEDTTAIAGAVRRLLLDRVLADDLRERGQRQAERFSWERSAAATLASYRRALA